MARHLIYCVVILAVVGCIAVAGISLADQTETTETLEYDLTYHDTYDSYNANPSHYTMGDYIELMPIERTGYMFGGWYLDHDFRTLCMKITPSMLGNLDLYAKWQDTMVGRELTYTFSGVVQDGLYKSFDVAGTSVVTYRCYDEMDGYFMHYASDVYYDYGSSVYSDKIVYDKHDPDQRFVLNAQGQETVETPCGERLCDVYTSEGYQDWSMIWIGHTDDVVYKIEEVINEKNSTKNADITFVLDKQTVVEVAEMYKLSVFADVGIRTTGSGMYEPDTKVIVTAEVEDGTTFDGWYDWDMNLLSKDKELEIRTEWRDKEIFAMNTYDPDYEVNTFEYSEFDLEVDDDTWWDICPYWMHDVEFTGKGSHVNCRFTEPGWYEVYIFDKDSEYYGYRTVYADGDAYRHYDWMYNGNEYSYDMWIDYDDIIRYYTMVDPEDRHCIVSPLNMDHGHEKQFVTPEDPYIQAMAKKFTEMTADMSDLDTAKFVLSFLKFVEYQSDDVFMGERDYWKYPLETLFDMGGDCEDSSILYVSIMKAMGYDTALVLFTDHAMGAIKMDKLEGDYNYFRGDDGSRYYYVESTASFEMFGGLPDSVDVKDRISIFI